MCPPGISLAPAFAADFPPDAHKFNQRTFHVRLINLCTADKKSSHKIRHKETPREHYVVFLNLVHEAIHLFAANQRTCYLFYIIPHLYMNYITIISKKK